MIKLKKHQNLFILVLTFTHIFLCQSTSSGSNIVIGGVIMSYDNNGTHTTFALAVSTTSATNRWMAVGLNDQQTMVFIYVFSR